MFTAAQFMAAKDYKQPTCPRISIFLCIQTTAYCASVKRMNWYLNNMSESHRLTERSQTQRAHPVPFTLSLRTGKTR